MFIYLFAKQPLGPSSVLALLGTCIDASTAIQVVHCTSYIIVLFSPEQQLWPLCPLTLGNVLGQQMLETDRCSSLLPVPQGSTSTDTFIFPRKSIDNSSVVLEAMWLGHMTLLGTKTCRKVVCSCQTLHLASLSVSEAWCSVLCAWVGEEREREEGTPVADIL